MQRIWSSKRISLGRNLRRPLAASFSQKTDHGDGDLSWLTSDRTELKKLIGTSLIHEVTMGQVESINEVVPWFVETMPNSYFRQVDGEARTKHLKAISAMRDIGQDDMTIKMTTNPSATRTDVCMITSGGKHDHETLQQQIHETKGPPNSVLSRLSMYNSSDDSLGMNIFSFNTIETEQTKATSEDGKVIKDYCKKLLSGKQQWSKHAPPLNEDLLSPKRLEDYFPRCTPVYVTQSSPMHFAVQRHLYETVRGTHGTVVNAMPFLGEIPTKLEGRDSIWMSIASGNVPPDVLLKACVRACGNHGYEVYRSHIDVVDDTTVQGVPAANATNTNASKDTVTQLRLLLSPNLDDGNGRPASDLEALKRDIRRAKWLDDSVTDLALWGDIHGDHPMHTDRAEVIIALATMLHGPLTHTHGGETFASPQSIIELLKTQPNTWMGTAAQIADLFLDKFNPSATPTAQDIDSRHDALASKIEKLNATNAKLVLREMLKATSMTLRTNFYCEERYALALRVDPSVMATGTMGKAPETPLPFGVFFVKGREFSGFHCRFRDIARGGLRLVTPPTSDQMNLESSRHFDEVYNLSLAQQLKNKDIPEGGAKAVVLIDSPNVADDRRSETLRKSVMAFSDSLLDLIVKDSVSGLVDYLKHDELIYLGPDEQVVPEDIEWICNRAGQRGYPIPAAFMSSKARNGINHKVYGVTSEGVVVHLVTALEEHLKIDPKKEPFTVKVTGGPDGDVAGNFIKIMHRDYPDTCKIVGIADGFGVAEDPDGLDFGEMMRLFEEALPISEFNASMLGTNGVVMRTDCEEGVERRNTMHFRVKSDAFVPAGGRPNTINEGNWHNFIDESGVPSSPLIVEGANIFTTVGARQKLFEEGGVAIVKDSSANKCGVITSSDEIACSMLIEEQEFLDCKEELVDDVIERIRHLAKLEAKLLFREYNNYPGSLPHFSERISNAINSVTDACTEALDGKGPGDEVFDELYPVIKDNLPAKLAEMAWDRVPDKFPLQYQRNAIASTLASRLVYKEGIHFIEAQSKNDLSRLAFAHYHREREVAALTERMEAGDPEALQEAVALLRKGGTRTVLDIF